MPVVVTGSIATDHLMTFPGRFTEQFVEGQMENVSLSFLVDDLVQHRGGAGANMAYGLGLLGLAPVLVGAVGSDFADYEAWLSRHGVDTGSVHWSELKHTARFVCTTDEANNQIASFYSGAMAEAAQIELAPVVHRVGAPDLVVVGPNDPTAMVRHTQECRQRGYAFAADPSQQLAWADGEMIRELVHGAEVLFTNEYESALLLQKTGWTADEVLARVGTWVTTRAADGVLVRREGEAPLSVIAVPETKPVEPTGGGDALRAGFIAGRTWGLGLERATQLGSAVATAAVEVIGTQEYDLPRQSFLQRFAEAFGAEAADEVAAHLPG
ncbi:carbohydrate kinase family protein [Blastococcus sp. MG754426]|uniref:carbohydrate kinase family protein n=1 Tax=unclassified Blastococcus TaxID=2619396 RepID=UPI001EF0518E|nr:MULTISPECIES: carbohydrate kinase family protein [unclassified Blastococcus]MCF6507995.1 carbohydrate kinase family protein [Blastococcus sp. MG754426]MCF6512635.1 carbohydrate kinase family protein [Blastococcus sp. MG754427]MCF6734029.1 carbohydrate kinase family protein [Blastococcus sp. KM273129]